MILLELASCLEQKRLSISTRKRNRESRKAPYIRPLRLFHVAHSGERRATSGAFRARLMSSPTISEEFPLAVSSTMSKYFYLPRTTLQNDNG